MKIPPSIDALLGVPFLLGGRDWQIGLDCHGLVLAAAAVWGIAVPDVWDLVEAEYRTCGGSVEWDSHPLLGSPVQRLDEARRGDVVAVRGATTPAVTHLVIAEGGGWCLTTSDGHVSRRAQLRRFRDRVHSIWRFPCV